MLPSELIAAFSKEAVLSEKQEDLLRRKRFRRIHSLLEEHGAETGATMKRIIVPKRLLSTEDINRLQFKAVTIAVPEAGQQQIRTYRHPLSGHHIHDHGDAWVIHHDSKPATTMLWEKDRLRRQGKLTGMLAPHEIPGEKPKKHKSMTAPPSRLDLVRSTVEGMPHLIGEGVPGMAAYLKGRVVRSKGMKERVLDGLDPKVMKRIESWRDSPSVRRQMAGAAPHAHPAATGAPS